MSNKTATVNPPKRYRSHRSRFRLGDISENTNHSEEPRCRSNSVARRSANEATKLTLVADTGNVQVGFWSNLDKSNASHQSVRRSERRTMRRLLRLLCIFLTVSFDPAGCRHRDLVR